MPPMTAAEAGPLREVLARFGVTPRLITTIPTGRMNRHWRVATATGRYALRRYSRTSPDDIAFELRVLEELAAWGWPVAAALATVDGARTTVHAGRCYALFPFLPGRPHSYASSHSRRRKGGLLARLHDDLARLPARAQRPGHHRLAEPERALRGAGYADFADLLAPYARHDPAGGDTLHREWEETLADIEQAGHGQPAPLPDILIHADFHTANLLFQRGHLTGLLDLDSTRLDWRIADVAIALSLDCREAPQYHALSPEAVRAFLGGYLAVSPLREEEQPLLLPLVRMHTLGMTGMLLREWALTGDPRALRSIERTVHGRIPAWQERHTALAATVAAQPTAR